MTWWQHSKMDVTFVLIDWNWVQKLWHKMWKANMVLSHPSTSFMSVWDDDHSWEECVPQLQSVIRRFWREEKTENPASQIATVLSTWLLARRLLNVKLMEKRASVAMVVPLLLTPEVCLHYCSWACIRLAEESCHVILMPVLMAFVLLFSALECCFTLQVVGVKRSRDADTKLALDLNGEAEKISKKSRSQEIKEEEIDWEDVKPVGQGNILMVEKNASFSIVQIWKMLQTTILFLVHSCQKHRWHVHWRVGEWPQWNTEHTIWWSINKLASPIPLMCAVMWSLPEQTQVLLPRNWEVPNND